MELPEIDLSRIQDEGARQCIVGLMNLVQELMAENQRFRAENQEERLIAWYKQRLVDERDPSARANMLWQLGDHSAAVEAITRVSGYWESKSRNESGFISNFRSTKSSTLSDSPRIVWSRCNVSIRSA